MKIRGAIAVVVIVAGWAAMTRGTQPNTVTKVIVTAKPSSYNGPCPTTAEFVGTVFVSKPTRVEYRWERSDGAMGPRESIDIRAAGKGVTTTWRTGTPRRSFSGWQRLHVLAPNNLVSNSATIQLKCN